MSASGDGISKSMKSLNLSEQFPAKPIPAKPREVFDPVETKDPPYVYRSSITESSKDVVYDVRFCPFITTKDYFASAVGPTLTVYEATPNGKLEVKTTYKDKNNDEEFYTITWCMTSLAPDRELLVVFAGKTQHIRARNPFKANSDYTYYGHSDSVNDLATDPSRPYLFASASKDWTVRLWHVKQQQAALAVYGGLKAQRDQVLSVDIHKSGNYIASGSMDHTVRVWRISDSQAVLDAIKAAPRNAEKFEDQPRPVEVIYNTAMCKDIHSNYVDYVKFIGNYILSKSCEPSMTLFKFGDFDDASPCGSATALHAETLAQKIATFYVPETSMWYIKFAYNPGPPGQAWIACGNQAGEIHLWDSHKQPMTIRSNFVLNHAENPSFIRAVDFNRSGTILIAGGQDGRIIRYDRSTEVPKKPYIKKRTSTGARGRGRGRRSNK